MTEQNIKVLIGKPGLDGHDRGAKMVALALKEAGMDVVYTGLHQSVEQIVETAQREHVDVIGLSIMSGVHLTICRDLLAMLAQKGMASTRVVVGGVIPEKDMAQLEQMGVHGIFPGGTPFDEIVSGIQRLVRGPS